MENRSIIVFIIVVIVVLFLLVFMAFSLSMMSQSSERNLPTKSTEEWAVFWSTMNSKTNSSLTNSYSKYIGKSENNGRVCETFYVELHFQNLEIEKFSVCIVYLDVKDREQLTKTDLISYRSDCLNESITESEVQCYEYK